MVILPHHELAHAVRRVDIAGPAFPAVAAWIHGNLQPEALRNLIAQVRQRHIAHPLPPACVAMSPSGRLVAAAYFNRLPGQAANLGGVRAEPGHERLSAELVRSLCGELCDLGVAQVQTILPSDDVNTPAILADAGFRQLATVQHMWLTDLCGVDSAPVEKHAGQPPVAQASNWQGLSRASSAWQQSRYRWIDASQIAFRRLAKLVDDTFVGTLDCPALNGLRTPHQVLQGFLEDIPLRTIHNWEVLELEGELIGCLFLKQHAHQTLELGYMGLVPHQRGWGLGHLLLQRLLARGTSLRARHAVVAVDVKNSPAVQLYLRHGFLPDSLCNVWLYESAK